MIRQNQHGNHVHFGQNEPDASARADQSDLPIECATTDAWLAGLRTQYRRLGR
jgi:hypothetical protein